MKTANTYKGYKIVLNIGRKRFEAKDGRKVRFHNSSLADLEYTIDAWLRNVECSDRIAATPYKAGSPNAGLY